MKILGSCIVQEERKKKEAKFFAEFPFRYSEVFHDIRNLRILRHILLYVSIPLQRNIYSVRNTVNSKFN
jgi:hypothetical protein